MKNRAMTGSVATYHLIEALSRTASVLRNQGLDLNDARSNRANKAHTKLVWCSRRICTTLPRREGSITT